MKRILLSIAALALFAIGAAHAVNISGTNESSKNQVMNIGFLRMSVTDTITAFAGGGQTSAVVLNSALNRVTTVASGNDSVKLPLCQDGIGTSGPPGAPSKTTGMIMYVVNAAASNSMNLYPAVGGSINALSANTAYAILANKTVAFVCVGTIWYSLLGS
jgi:sugar/nucleoside kinase (ribokinase family)